MNKEYDVIVIGGGPAGLSAALYAARAQFSVLVLEKETIGGQITITDEVVNYPGVKKTSGKQLTEEMRKQAESFGAKFLLAEVTDVALKDKKKIIKTNKGEFVSAGVIIATGASPRKLGFPGESEYQGHGVAYCATCDGEFFTGKDVFVIGGGFAAAEEAMFLTKYAKKVTIIVREPDFTCAPSIADEVKAHDKIDIHYHTEVKETGGNANLEYVIFENNETHETWRYDNKEESFGIFVFAGYVPATSLFLDQVANDRGYLITDEDQKTDLDGVYAAGDVCIKNLRQVVTAVSDGATAATALEKYLPAVLKELNLQTEKPVATVHAEEPAKETETTDDDGAFISSEIRAQLQPIYEKLTGKLVFKCHFNEDGFSKELKNFVEEFITLHPSLSYDETLETDIPTIAFYDEDGNALGVEYHAVPGGHEFNSFVLGVYNAIGPKQAADEETLKTIHGIQTRKSIKVLMSLSCTMCPEVVQSSQRIALENPNVDVGIYDLQHFPELKEQYNVMSVPCMIIDDQDVYFGKKDMQAITELLIK